VHARNDAGFEGYVGAAPPPGHGPHRYYFAVHALGVERLDVEAGAPPALCGFQMFGSTLGRAALVGLYER